MYKGGTMSKGKFMDNGKGMCSYKDNPMPKASQVKPECGPGMNADQRKANKLLQQQHSKRENLRGVGGM